MEFHFPKTPHLWGTTSSEPGEVVLDSTQTGQVLASSVTLEEKLDGSNLGIDFDSTGSRRFRDKDGRFIEFSEHSNIQTLWQTFDCVDAALRRTVGSRFILFGEWLYVVHVQRYRCLPSYFLPFDFFDKENESLLSGQDRARMLVQLGMGTPPTVPVRFPLTPETFSDLPPPYCSQEREGLIVRTLEPTPWGSRFKVLFARIRHDRKNLWTPSTFDRNVLSRQSSSASTE